MFNAGDIFDIGNDVIIIIAKFGDNYIMIDVDTYEVVDEPMAYNEMEFILCEINANFIVNTCDVYDDKDTIC